MSLQLYRVEQHLTKLGHLGQSLVFSRTGRGEILVWLNGLRKKWQLQIDHCLSYEEYACAAIMLRSGGLII